MEFFNVSQVRFFPDQNIMPAKAIAIEYHFWGIASFIRMIYFYSAFPRYFFPYDTRVQTLVSTHETVLTN